MEEYFRLMGYRVRDTVTGFTGVVTSITFDLYGCVQALVHPGVNKEGEERDRAWFDLNRLKAIGEEPVMPVPDFMGQRPGGQEKPLPR